MIEPKDILDYSFHDESGKYIVKLNVPNLKKIFKADEIILEETEHK